MKKPYTVPETDVMHYVLPELSGRIVGLRDKVVRPQTVEEIEALQKQAYDEAKKSGHAEGLKQGLQQGLQEMKVKANQLQSILNFLQNPIEDVDQQVEQQITELALILAKQLLRKESEMDEKHIHTLVHESLEYLPVKAKNIRVRLNPADIALLNEADVDTSEQKWKYVSDVTIKAGGCIIESNTSLIDASVEKRVEQLIDQLGIESTEDENDETE